MPKFLSVLFLILFSFTAFAQQHMLTDYGTADVSGKAIVEAPMAPVVFLDQAPNQVNGLFSDSSCALCGTLQQSIAANFNVVTAGPTYGITEVVMWCGYYPENIPNTTDNFTFILHSDAAGSPGAIVDARYNLQPASRVTTGVVLFGVDEYMCTFDFSASPIMITSTGTYWLEIYNNSVESANFFWETGNLDVTNGVVGSAWTTTTPGVTWNLDPATELAVQISGDDNLGGGGGGDLPELIYYTFDENGGTTTANLADPGAGTNPAPLAGTTTWATPGQFGSAIIGDATAAGGVVTGYNWDRGAGDWTISMWLEIPTDPAGSAYYLFGDGGSTSFRCFHNGVALPDNLVLRGGGLTDCVVTGIGPNPTVVTFVYDSSVPEVVAYKDGMLFANFPQAALNMPVGTGFTVGGYGGSATMKGKMDEFRVYNRALSAAEVAATWNITLVPVELTSFTASVSANNVKLLWETATEINNSGFNIERKSANSEYSTVGFVPGFGTTTEPKSYIFNDKNLHTGTYTYRLKQIDFDGTFEYSSEATVEVTAPAEFSLDQNYPNPFNPSTKITFSLAVNSKVSLKIFDVLGQEVASLVSQDLTAGVHNYDFNAIGFNSGVYFYRIEANGIDGTNFTNVKKMILLK
jgi:hypothetical protein